MAERKKPKPTARKACPTPSGWTPRRSRATGVGELVPQLMRPAFEKFGFPAAALLTDWSAVAGSELAAFTAPERLKWPRRGEGPESEGADKGATLLLRVSGARALEVEQMRPRLIERINAAFGYRAVSNIRIIQAPLPKSGKAGKTLPKPLSTDQQRVLDDLTDDRLRNSLARMAAGIRARQDHDQRAGS